MPKSQAIILGMSPFINSVDIPRLCRQYTTFGVNRIGYYFDVDYLFFYDWYHEGHRPSTVVIPNWFKEDGLKYVPKPCERPIVGATQDGLEVLGFRNFTVTSAFNYALCRGFRDIYLVGVDHVDTDGAFKHFDWGEYIDPPHMTPEVHHGVKSFICAGQQYANVYQCNPAVVDDWQLPYKDLNELYAQEEAS